MAQIFDSLKALIEPELARAAATLGEKDSKVRDASTSILSGLLANIVKEGNTPAIDSALKEAGNTDVLNDLPCIFSGNETAKAESAANKFLQAVTGGKTEHFTSAVSASSGISKESANRLTTMIGSVVAAFLGKKLKSGSKTSDLIKELDGEKNRFMAAVPPAIASTLGLSAGNNKGTVQKKKKNSSWLIWLLLVIALILLIIFGWRSCKNKKAAETVQVTEVQVTPVPVPVPVQTEAPVRSLITIQLPNGTSFEAYRNGMEEKIVNFLNSNEYKNAKTDADLKDKWFEFEDIDFFRDSATELMEGAQPHLNNMAAILKAYPDAKIRIAGNADKSGHTEYNMEISRERAATIRSILAGSGIASGRISTEGFGDEYATVPAAASDDARAKDRDIAFRFTK